MGLKRRVWADVDYVMCCRECNTIMGAMHPYILSERIAYLIERFTKKYKLHKPRIQWDEEELSELSFSLATYIQNSMAKWNKDNQRLDHMRLRHIQVAHEELESVDRTHDMIGPVQP